MRWWVQDREVHGQDRRKHRAALLRQTGECVEPGRGEPGSCCLRKPGFGGGAQEEQQRDQREEQREDLAASADAVHRFTMDRVHGEEQGDREGEALRRQVDGRQAMNEQHHDEIEGDIRGVEAAGSVSPEQTVESVREVGDGPVERTIRLAGWKGERERCERAGQGPRALVGHDEAPIVVGEIRPGARPVDEHAGEQQGDRELAHHPGAGWGGWSTGLGSGITSMVTTSGNGGVGVPPELSTTRIGSSDARSAA